MPSIPNFSIELSCSGIVAGIDEAGRGPWAGPVVAAAVILDRSKRIYKGLNDSKKMTQEAREEFFLRLTEHAHTGVGMASVEEIDQLNILQATLVAMQRAVAALPHAPDIALIDGNKAPKLPCQTRTVIGGDGLSRSIAAASVIAKVTRDRLMRQLANEFPHYGWERNAGYGTAAHQAGLAAHGVTIHHRRSFRPIRELLEARTEAA